MNAQRDTRPCRDSQIVRSCGQQSLLTAPLSPLVLHKNVFVHFSEPTTLRLTSSSEAALQGKTARVFMIFFSCYPAHLPVF